MPILHCTFGKPSGICIKKYATMYNAFRRNHMLQGKQLPDINLQRVYLNIAIGYNDAGKLVSKQTTFIFF